MGDLLDRFAPPRSDADHIASHSKSTAERRRLPPALVRDPSGVVERRISGSLGHSRGNRSLGSGNRSLRSRVGRRSSGHTAGGAGLASGGTAAERRPPEQPPHRRRCRAGKRSTGAERTDTWRTPARSPPSGDRNGSSALLASTAEKSAGRSESRQENDLVHRLKTLSEGANSKVVECGVTPHRVPVGSRRWNPNSLKGVMV